MGWNPKKTFRSIKEEWDRFRTSETGATLLGFISAGVGGDPSTALAGAYEANRTAAAAKKAKS